MNYYKRREISNSDMSYLVEGYDHYLNAKKTPVDSKAMEIGRLFHSVILEDKGFYFCDESQLIKISKEQGKKITRANPEYKEWLSKQQGVALDLDTFIALEYWKKYFKENKLYVDGEVEQEFYFEHQDVSCRSKLDFIDVENNIVRDLKTFSKTPTFKNIKNTIYSNSWYRQCYFYKLAYLKKYAVEPDFIFDLITLTKPYKHIEIRISSESFEEMAENEIMVALENFKNKTVIQNYEF